MLGGFGLTVGDRTVEERRWRLNKARSLVKLLALARGHALHREQVAALLWPSLDEKRAANNLHRALHCARGVVGGLRLRDGLLSLRPDGDLWVDVEAFEGAAATARLCREPAVYRAAVDLYAGDLLPEDRGEAWADERREGLRLTYLSLLLEGAALHEERGEHGPAIELLRRSLAEEPAHEDAHAALIRLLALRGERGEALLQYERLRRALSREFGVEPGPAVRRLYEEVRSGRPPTASAGRRPMGPVGSHPNNLPAPLTSFVGRERALPEVKRLLSMTRLLTLTGAGGCGKTRLALELARGLVGTFGGGVWLVELAALHNPDLVARAVAAAIGVPEQPGRPLEGALADHLGKKSSLLVLDNCEHLTDGAARLTHALLGACPNLKVLATSREPLGVPGETLWTVSPLSLPERDTTPTAEALMHCEAVRLFVERARSRLPAFELTPQNAAATASVCRKLDGIPLAIELATARLGALAVEQVSERLEGSLGLLTGGARTADPRHQTMRATIRWSYALLSGPEREAFERLSVFAGGWTLGAAEEVCRGGGVPDRDDVLSLLSRLVDKSLVVADVPPGTGEEVRYRMLEPIRQYGRERLEAGGEADAVRRRHASWCFGLAREVEPWLRGAHQEAWLWRLEREYGNLRAALRWAQESGEAELGLWFGGAMAEFWYMNGHLGEARRWLEAALANRGDAPPTPARVRALARAAWLAWEGGDYERSEALGRESLAVSRGLGDDAGAAGALTTLGWAALSGGDLGRALARAREAEGLAQGMGDAGGVARALLVEGLVANVRSDHERALALHERSLALARASGDGVGLVISTVTGVLARLGLGDAPRAEALCEAGFAFAPRPRVANLTAFQLQACAALAAYQGHPARAARLWGAAEALREAIGAALSPTELRVYAPYVAAARASFDGAAWEEAWAEGRAMTAEEAEGYALAQRGEPRRSGARRTPSPTKPPVIPQSQHALTRREREVASLVVRGLTNRQIAGALSISEHTAATHVRRILKKLGLHSRAGISIWVTQQDPKGEAKPV